MISDKDQLLVEKYVDGQMTAEEVRDFQERINAEPAIASAVKAYQISLDAVDLLVEDHLDKKLASLRLEVQSSPIKKLNPWKKWGAIAASFLILIFAAGGIYSNQFSSKNLSQNYFERYEAATRSDNTDPAMQSFQEGNYQDAIQLFRAAVQNDPDDMTSRFYLAQSYFEMGEYELASKEFEAVYNSDDIRYREAAQWNAVLSQINFNEAQARQNLKVILESESSYQQEAKELLQKIDSFWHLN